MALQLLFRQLKSVFLGMFFCLICSLPALAGDWSVLVGAGGGDCETVTADLSVRYTFRSFYTNRVLEVSPLLEGSFTYWHHNLDDDELGGGISGGLQIVFSREGIWRPYISGTFGGFLISDDEFGTHNLGGSFQFRSKGAVGIQFGRTYRHRIQLNAAHFSNAGIYNRNTGFNSYGITWGFRF